MTMTIGHKLSFSRPTGAPYKIGLVASEEKMFENAHLYYELTNEPSARVS